MPTPVKWFSSSQTGAPVLSGTAGALISVLDACLVTGFGLQSVSSLAVAAGVATITVPGTPAAVANSVILVAGATPAGLNGEQRVLATTSNTITFATTEANVTATGTITVKLAPAGWAKEFAGTNLAAYRSSNVASTRQWLRADDTSTITANMRAYESMSDINTGVDMWMNNYWFKGVAANTNAVAWELFADDRTFYLRTATGNQDAIYPFGDFTPVRANDPFACMGPNGYAANTVNSGSNKPAEVTVNGYPIASVPTASLLMPRSANFLSKAVQGFKRPGIPADHYQSTGDYSMSSGCRGPYGYLYLPYPNTSNNALVFNQYNVFETSNRNLRGTLRGVFNSPQWLTASFTQSVTTLDGQGDFAGRKIAVVTCNGGREATGAGVFSAAGSTQYTVGRLIVDLTGPW